jgi:hypothetical protein
MRRFSPLNRLLLTALAIVQMATPALAVIADAKLIADSATAPRAHIEEHSQKGCRPVHPDDCALCSLLTHFSAPRPTAAALPMVAAAARAVRDREARLPDPISRALDRTRAPPVSPS